MKLRSQFAIGLMLAVNALGVSAQQSSSRPESKTMMVAQADKVETKADIPTPLSVCTDRASANYANCYAGDHFTKDSCDALYQQAINICYSTYK